MKKLLILSLLIVIGIITTSCYLAIVDADGNLIWGGPNKDLDYELYESPIPDIPEITCTCGTWDTNEDLCWNPNCIGHKCTSCNCWTFSKGEL